MKTLSSLLSLIFLLSTNLSCNSLSKGQSGSAPQDRYVGIPARNPVIGLRKRVIVLPFIDSAKNRTQKVSDAARKAFIRSLTQTNRFVIVNPTDLPKDVNSFKKADSFDLKALAKMASGADISAIIEGSILNLKATKLGDQVGVFRKVNARVKASIRLRAVSVKHQKEIYNDVRSASVESSSRQFGKYNYSDRMLSEDPKLVFDSVSKAFRGSIRGITSAIEKLHWEGRIALIRGDRIFINAGRVSGLQIGDILRVTSWGEEVFDPETGVFIGRSPGRPKGTVEVISYFGKDGAVSIIHSGGGFDGNDKVELY